MARGAFAESLDRRHVCVMAHETKLGLTLCVLRNENQIMGVLFTVGHGDMLVIEYLGAVGACIH